MSSAARFSVVSCVLPDAGVMVKPSELVAVCAAEPLDTVTSAEPAEARAEAGTAAWSWLALTYVVCNAVPFHSTCEPVP
jgi:hypothetical protein